MTTRQLLYLAQLENYDVTCLRTWFMKNPGRGVEEKKHRLVWTMKVRVLFVLITVISLFVSKEKALFVSLYCLTPFDVFVKSVVYGCAWAVRRILHPKMRVIGVAGSWGKTTMKMSLAATLNSKYRVITTEGNINTIMGVALSVLRLPVGTEIFICEMDAFYRGEIARVCQLIQPEVGVLTAVGPMHLERFHDDMNALVRAQFELPEYVKKEGVFFIQEDIQIPKGVAIQSMKKFKEVEDGVREVAKYFDVALSQIQLARVEHRNEVSVVNGLIIIDDAYNSNPTGFRRALQTLKNTKATMRIIVTPGMIELGAVQEKENREAAQEAAKVCDVIIVVGEENKKALVEGARGAKKTVWVPDLVEVQQQLRVLAKPGSAILFENDLTDQYF
ncbi:MAG: hypothetical protein HZA34_02890 [Candidatus Pacebacteria bacterium]|nr:hypothetical protein [Candidatus Paceibacterota bacterium]